MKIAMGVKGSALALFAAVGLVATAGEAIAATPVTHVTINHSVIYLGQTASIAGYVTPAAPSHVVYLQTLSGTAWKSISSARLNSTSHYSFTVKPAALAKYTLRVYDPPTSSGLARNYSPNVTLTTVRPTVRIAINHSVIHAGTNALVSGYVSANAHGHVVYLQNLTSAGWTSIAHVALDTASRYTFSVRPSARATYTFRVYDPATSTGIPYAYSPNVRLAVQTPGNVTLADYSGTADYQGPRIRIPTVDYELRLLRPELPVP